MKIALATSSRCLEQIRCLDRHLFSAKAVHNSRRDSHVSLSCSVGIAVQVVYLQHANVEPRSVVPVVANATSVDFTDAGLSSRCAHLVATLSKQSPNENRAFFHSIGVLGASHEVVNPKLVSEIPARTGSYGPLAADVEQTREVSAVQIGLVPKPDALAVEAHIGISAEDRPAGELLGTGEAGKKKYHCEE